MTRPQPFDDARTLSSLRWNISAERVILAGLRLMVALERRAHFDPAQPRDDLGRWTDTGATTSTEIAEPGVARPDSALDGRVRVAGAFDHGLVDLREEESIGDTHSIAEHVGKSDAKLLARVRGDAWYGYSLDVVRMRDGSFSSIEAANKLVNATLAKNAEVVEDVAAGRESDAFVKAEFGYPTGREAYRTSARSTPFIRTTTGVGVYIVHDRSTKRGFRIQTAYPRNE